MNNFLLVNLLLALLWASLQYFRPIDMIGGFAIGYVLIWLGRDWLGADATSYVKRIPRLIAFFVYYFGELVSSTLDVIRALFRDQKTLKPGIIAFPLDAKTDLEIVLFNNLLVLSPGTLGVTISPDRTILYIHIIDMPDAESTRLKIKLGLEKRLLEVLR